MLVKCFDSSYIEHKVLYKMGDTDSEEINTDSEEEEQESNSASPSDSEGDGFDNPQLSALGASSTTEIIASVPSTNIPTPTRPGVTIKVQAPASLFQPQGPFDSSLSQAPAPRFQPAPTFASSVQPQRSAPRFQPSAPPTVVYQPPPTFASSVQPQHPPSAQVVAPPSRVKEKVRKPIVHPVRIVTTKGDSFADDANRLLVSITLTEDESLEAMLLKTNEETTQVYDMRVGLARRMSKLQFGEGKLSNVAVIVASRIAVNMGTLGVTYDRDITTTVVKILTLL